MEMVNIQTEEEEVVTEEGSVKSEFEEDTTVTQWNCVIWAGVITFLSILESMVIGISEWPYMHTIDPKATSQFFGLATAMSKVGHVIAVLLVSFWNYKTQQIKLPLIVGRLIAFIACIMYLTVEFIPQGRRYMMMTCYFLFGFAAAASSVLRNYLVLVSSREDRAKANSIYALGTLLSLIISPIIQIIFSFLPYPGVKVIFNKLRLNLYSAPIWIATLINFISITLIIKFLDDPPKIHRTSTNAWSWQSVQAKLRHIRDLHLPWILIVVLLLMKFASNIPLTSLSVMGAPLMMAGFNWSGQKVVTILAICMGVVGLECIGITVAYFFGLGKVLSCRLSLLISMILAVALYIISYPYPFISTHFQPFNETSETGCNPQEYNWCDKDYVPNPIVFLVATIAVMGFVVPMCQIAVDTIYSHLLGNIDQSLMQGALVVVDDVIQMISPLYASKFFTAFGQGILWISNFAISVTAVLIWLLSYRAMKKYT